MYSLPVHCLRFSFPLEKYRGRKLFFFTDNPSGFPSSGNKHLRLGYAAETRNCRRKDCLILKLPGAAAAQTGHLAYPLVLLCRWQGKRKKGFLPQKNSFRPRYLPAGRKTEFEWKGINEIRASPELGMPEIQSRFPLAVWRGNLLEKRLPISVLYSSIEGSMEKGCHIKIEAE